MTDLNTIKNVNVPINIFRKSIFSDEERKMPIKFVYENFIFFCKHADLTAPLEVFPSSNYNNPYYASNWMEAFCRDYACFMFEYNRDVYSHLSGFCGFDCVTFEFDKRINISFNVNVK